MTSWRARKAFHTCLTLEFIQEPTTFHSISFNISALTLSDLGSKMPDSCCSVGCSNRQGDQPGCFQLIVDVFWVNLYVILIEIQISAGAVKGSQVPKMSFLSRYLCLAIVV